MNIRKSLEQGLFTLALATSSCCPAEVETKTLGPDDSANKIGHSIAKIKDSIRSTLPGADTETGVIEVADESYSNFHEAIEAVRNKMAIAAAGTSSPEFDRRIEQNKETIKTMMADAYPLKTRKHYNKPDGMLFIDNGFGEGPGLDESVTPQLLEYIEDIRFLQGHNAFGAKPREVVDQGLQTELRYIISMVNTFKDRLPPDVHAGTDRLLDFLLNNNLTVPENAQKLGQLKEQLKMSEAEEDLEQRVSGLYLPQICDELAEKEAEKETKTSDNEEDEEIDRNNNRKYAYEHCMRDKVERNDEAVIRYLEKLAVESPPPATQPDNQDSGTPDAGQNFDMGEIMENARNAYGYKMHGNFSAATEYFIETDKGVSTIPRN